MPGSTGTPATAEMPGPFMEEKTQGIPYTNNSKNANNSRRENQQEQGGTPATAEKPGLTRTTATAGTATTPTTAGTETKETPAAEGM
jgi:hypothetical protein